MAGRRHQTVLRSMQVQDPGKDLFAYLFLLIMIFSFMLLMTMDERIAALQGKKAPQQVEATSSLATVAHGVVGQLRKKDGRLVLSFAGCDYKPDSYTELADAGVIVEQDNGKGQVVKTIYIQKEDNSAVLLSEYLTAFTALNKQGISVAFAEVL